MMRTLALMLVLLSWCSLGEAARTVTSEGVMAVKLELGQPTAMVFPEEVSTVTTAMPCGPKPEDPCRLMITKDNMYVGFLPHDPTMPPNRQIVVGVSGRVYLVMVEIVASGKRGDDIVYVTHKAPPQGDMLTPASVMRTLRSPKGPGPAQPLTLPLPTPADPRLTLSQPQQYTLGPYQALVLTITNTQETVLHLDERVGLAVAAMPGTARLHEWVWPPNRRLEAVAIAQPMVPPHGTTTLYAIFKER
jgi:hypothetical protein